MTTVKGKKLIKACIKSVKQTLASQGLNSNVRNLDKELDYCIKAIIANRSNTEINAAELGKQLGEQIADLSRQAGKTSVDKEVIRQMYLLLEKQKVTNTESKNKTAKVISVYKPETPVSPTDVSQSVTEAVEAVAESVSSTISETAENAAESISEITETVSETVENAAESVSKTAENAAESVSEIAENAAESVSEIAENAAEKSYDSTLTTPNTSLSLKERIGEDIKSALKAQDKVRLETVRSIKKVILEKEVELRPSGQEELTPEQEIELLAQQAKQRRDSIEQYRQAGRDDLADQEAQELAIIETYLPKQLSDEELQEIISQIISEVGASGPADMGKVMGPAMKQLKGRADGKKVQALVKEKLS